MFRWLRQFGQAADRPVAPASVEPGHDNARVVGQYRSLYTFLEHRYSNTVVMTFTQLEDVLGFPLPELARTDSEWWTAPSTSESRQSLAWTLAHMTAKPNFLAQNVIFERAP